MTPRAKRRERIAVQIVAAYMKHNGCGAIYSTVELQGIPAIARLYAKRIEALENAVDVWQARVRQLTIERDAALARIDELEAE